MRCCSSLLCTVFLPLQFGRSFRRNGHCVIVQLPQGCSSLPPSLLFLSPWSGLVSASRAATAAAVGLALPQFSIKTPNLNGAFKPRPAPVLPLPPIPPCSDSAFFLPFSLCGNLMALSRKRSQLWHEDFFLAGSEELNERIDSWKLAVGFQSLVSHRSIYDL